MRDIQHVIDVAQKAVDTQLRTIHAERTNETT